jgi:hypothetical protein
MRKRNQQKFIHHPRPARNLKRLAKILEDEGNKEAKRRIRKLRRTRRTKKKIWS